MEFHFIPFQKYLEVLKRYYDLVNRVERNEGSFPNRITTLSSHANVLTDSQPDKATNSRGKVNFKWFLQARREKQRIICNNCWITISIRKTCNRLSNSIIFDYLRVIFLVFFNNPIVSIFLLLLFLRKREKERLLSGII